MIQTVCWKTCAKIGVIIWAYIENFLLLECCLKCKITRKVFGPGRRVPKRYSLTHLLFLESVLYKVPKMPNTQRSATKLCMHILADIADRSTVSDFQFIF